MTRVKAQHAFRGLALTLVRGQVIGDMDALNDQDVAVFFDLAYRLGRKVPLAGRNFARLQRAPEGAGQSATRRRNQVVQRRCVRIDDVCVHAVMLRNLGMHAEEHRIQIGRQIRPPQRTLQSLDSYQRPVNNFICHNRPQFLCYRFGPLDGPGVLPSTNGSRLPGQDARPAFYPHLSSFIMSVAPAI